MKQAAALVLALAAGFVLTGCPRHHIRHKHPGPPAHAKARGHVKHRGKVVVIKKGHKHSAHCGHYRHGGRWYLHGGHVHRHGCGHAFRGGIWVLVD